METSTPTPQPLRVIIAGSGPTGLITAHILSRFPSSIKLHITILEKRSSVIEPSGAGLGLWPQGVRLLDQLGLLPAAQAISSPMTMSYHFAPDGKETQREPLFDNIQERHGYPFMMFERVAFVRMLWEMLPKDVVVRIGKRVVDVVLEEAGAKVVCEDGSEVECDFVVGADGVNSAVRETMLKHAGAQKADEKALKSTYQCIYGCSPLLDGATPGDMIETHNKYISFHLLNQPDRIFWFLFHKLTAPETTPKFYTKAEMEALAEKLADHPVDANLKFGDLWKSRMRAKLANLEEGVFETWHSGRIVLLGDSVHKMTPNLALGFNTAFESAVVLANHLYRAIASSSSHQLTKDQVQQVFSKYRTERISRAKTFVETTGGYTRFAAWDGFGLQTSAKWAPKILGDTMASVMSNRFARLVQRGPKLDFLPLPENMPQGTLKWVDEAHTKPPTLSDGVLYVAGVAGAAIVGVWVVWRWAGPLSRW